MYCLFVSYNLLDQLISVYLTGRKNMITQSETIGINDAETIKEHCS